MKKLALLTLLVGGSLVSNAQLYLSGTGPYTQDFNSITSSAPTGWIFDTGATATYIGRSVGYTASVTFGVFDTSNTNCTGSVRAAGFKNFASANVILGTDTCGTQNNCTDRAIGVRQISSFSNPGWDPGAAFTLRLANTFGMTNVTVGFKLQSLDRTSQRVTTWKLQYGIGSSPTTWTDVATTGTMTTGGFTFSNTPITASFGAALDNIFSNVCIRLVTLNQSSGSNQRPSTAIDDFTINWTGSAKTGISEVSAAPALGLTVLGEATADNITFGYNAETTGNYSFIITDISGRTIHTETVNASNGDQQFSVNGLNLASGMYIAKMTNGNSSTTAKIIVQ